MTEFFDNYGSDNRIASQLESEWSDVLLGKFVEEHIPRAKRIGFDDYLVRPTYYRDAARRIAAACERGRLAPTSAVDIGSGLGRLTYELLLRLPSVESATCLEPSPTLSSWAEVILTPGAEPPRVPIIKGLNGVVWHTHTKPLPLDPPALRKIRWIRGLIDALEAESSRYDLVTCLNVLDQCSYPSRLAARAKALVRPRGLLALSCTYQFQERFYVDASTIFASLHDLFAAAEWELLDEADLWYVFHNNEGHWNRFSSHCVLYRRRT